MDAHLSLFLSSDLAATVVAHELRQIGDTLYWRYKLLEILIKNYETVSKIRWNVPSKWKRDIGFSLNWKAFTAKVEESWIRTHHCWQNGDSQVGCKLVETPWWRCWILTVRGLLSYSKLELCKAICGSIRSDPWEQKWNAWMEAVCWTMLTVTCILYILLYMWAYMHVILYKLVKFMSTGELRRWRKWYLRVLSLQNCLCNGIIIVANK